MKMKKLAIASAAALMFVGSAHAINFDNIVSTITTVTPTTVEVPGFTTTTNTYALPATTETVASLTAALGTNLLKTTTPVASVIGGAINTGIINGAIDISGTNVSLGALNANVSATASALTSDAYAIAGAKLSTTVIGAMNSSTVDVMGKSTNLTNSLATSLNVASLDSSGGTVAMVGDTLGASVSGLLGTVTGGAVLTAGTTTSLSLDGLTSSTTANATSLVTELQAMNVFNGAINVAALDAGIKIAANVDSGAWFLNPQTGIVNLSNISMATTAIGAMNSSITKLGVSLAK
jgi:hypothetical protein